MAQLKVAVYDGVMITEIFRIKPGSKISDALAALFNDSSRRWHYDRISYIPKVLIVSDDLSVNIGGNSVIVNVKHGNLRNGQMVTALTSDEVHSLKKLIYAEPSKEYVEVPDVDRFGPRPGS